MSYINTQDQRLRASILTNFLIAELLSSRLEGMEPLYLISPWITDFPLRVHGRADLAEWIDTLEPQPSLFDCIHHIAAAGRQVVIVIRTETASDRIDQFITPLRRRLSGAPTMHIRHQPDLHAKLYVGQYGALYGSFNLTRSGLERNVEFARYVSDTRTVAQLRVEARTIFDTSLELVS